MRSLNNKLIVTLLLMTLSLMANAQNILNATLQHGDELTVYSGADGFKNAYEAATDGDIIYLSPGTFNGSFNLDKELSVYGSGMTTSKGNEIQNTYINDYICIGWTKKMSNITLEGISFYEISSKNGFTNSSIKKCIISNNFGPSSSYYSNCTLKDCFIEQCVIPSLAVPIVTENVIFKNSRLGNIYCRDSYRDHNYYTGESNSNDIKSTLSFVNCDIERVSRYITAFYLNNIIHGVPATDGGKYSYPYSLTNYSTAFNNLFLHGQGTPDGAFNASGNYVLDAESEEIIYVNADETGMSLTGSYYELTGEAAAKYLGQDGTQVGIHGGETPFSIIPSYPHIVEKNIAGQSTSDGKLKVNIKVDVK